MPEGIATQEDYRLPKHVVPEHYDLKIWTDLEDLAFSGVVKIRYVPQCLQNWRASIITSINMDERSLRVIKDTSKIVLNSLALDLSDVSLYSETLQNTQEPSSIDFNDTNQRVLFTFPTTLPADSKAELSVSFKAGINTQLMGYYKSTGGKDGNVVYALTQFQVSCECLTYLSHHTPDCFSSPQQRDVHSHAGMSRGLKQRSPSR